MDDYIIFSVNVLSIAYSTTLHMSLIIMCQVKLCSFCDCLLSNFVSGNDDLVAQRITEAMCLKTICKQL